MGETDAKPFHERNCLKGSLGTIYAKELMTLALAYGSSLISTAREILKPVLELVYPTYCGGCGKQGDVLCRSCRQSLIPLDGPLVCPVCGMRTGSEALCGGCISHPIFFERGFYGFSFEGALREAVHAFKFKGRIDVGRALAREALPRAAACLANCVDAIGRSPSRRGDLRQGVSTSPSLLPRSSRPRWQRPSTARPSQK